MTVKFSTSLTNILSTATTKTDWANKFQAAFGNSIRLRMFWDSNANSTDPVVTGVEFLNVGITGPFILTGGNITGWGKSSGTTIRTSANLLTGKAVARIEGNGHTATFSLGLTRGKQMALGVATADLKDFDYMLFDQPSATSGIGFIDGTGVKSPSLLASGVGPAAPDVDYDTPAYYSVETFPDNDTTGVMTRLAAINVRDPNVTFDRDYIASQIGDVHKRRSAAGDGIVFGVPGGDCYRIAPMLLITDKSTNATRPDRSLKRMRFHMKPEGRWASYPYKPDFNITTDTLSPQAFKVHLWRSDKTKIDVIEMYSTRTNNVPGSGKPINGHSQYGSNPDGTPWTAPLQPWTTAFMTLSWQSDEYVPSKYLQHLVNPIIDEHTDPSNVINYDAWPDQWPIITGNNLANGLYAPRVAPKWSRAPSSGYDTSIVDTYFVNPWQDNFRTQFIGYGYEPGAVQHHVWYMSPGGHRHQRAMWPHYVVMWATNPNGVRIHGSLPYIDLNREWLRGYHNEGCHYFTDVELGKTLSKDHVIYGLDCYNDTYYNGGNENYRSNIIRLLTLINGGQKADIYKDKNGRPFTNEYQRDLLHNTSNAAEMVYLMNDPMGGFEARDSFNSSMLATWDINQNFPASNFLCREHSWLMKQFADTWVAGNTDANNMSSADIEFMATTHLGQMYDAVTAKMASNTIDGRALRDLGLVHNVYYADNGLTGSIQSYDSKGFYMGQVLMYMKQNGFYDRLSAVNPKNKLALELMVTQLCKASVPFYTLTKGAWDRTPNFIPFTVGTIPASFSWSDYPVTGQTDWIHDANGDINDNYPEGLNTTHMRAQWLWIKKYFFSDVPFDGLDAAITVAKGFYDFIENRRVTQGKPNWHWLMASFGRPKPPVYLGKPIITN